ncbi:MAG: hypothetical protein P4L56_07570 [Candidatus Sulfopaludibacter sp.]|nr:hypothetical protein [Candidatus Sulfopaludibacter sp.]
MRNACMFAALALVPAWGQTVKPTAGALAPVNAAPVATAEGAARTGAIPKVANDLAVFQKLEGDFDLGLKMADQANPLQVFGLTQGLYVPGFGAVFTAKVELATSNILPMFHPGQITAAEKATLHDRKIKHLDVLRKQMSAMMAASAKDLDLGPNDQIVLAVRLLYQGWEDRSGLPEQIVMKADRHGAQTGDIKTELQYK